MIHIAYDGGTYDTDTYDTYTNEGLKDQDLGLFGLAVFERSVLGSMGAMIWVLGIRI